MRGNFNFYSAVGCNAVGVFNDWSRLQTAKKYIKKCSVKGFDTFEDAENWALMQFSHYLTPFEDAPLKLPLNFVVHKNRLSFIY